MFRLCSPLREIRCAPGSRLRVKITPDTDVVAPSDAARPLHRRSAVDSLDTLHSAAAAGIGGNDP
jgi:hypothetical protein